MKNCCACGENRDVSLFNRNRAAKDGLQSRCRDCQKAYQKKWVDDNRDHVNAYNLRKYYNMTPDQRAKFDEARKRWEARNPESRRKSAAKYAANNKDKMRDIEARRRARKQNGGVYAVLPSELRRLSSSPCSTCGSTERIVLDHIIPLARGGRHSIGNLQPLCARCNSRKNARFHSDFRYRVLAKEVA